MNPNETTVSIIIPTHNRVHSVKRLLDKLQLQTYPLHLVEVIVVANSCIDTTVMMLQQYQAPFILHYAETTGNGPAVPRNKGASMATGTILIFLDDDVAPSENLAAAHVQSHENLHTVVVGYLPLSMPAKPDFFRLNLRSWWEDKFQKMRQPGHRFSYEDLLSGNFSISFRLFEKLNGFVTGFTCRDDYELGIRLLESGAQFKFAQQAFAIHCDEVTNLKRSLKRKVEEGKIDIRLWRLHPSIKNSFQYNYQKESYQFLESKKSFLFFNRPQLSDALARGLTNLMPLLEWLKIRGKWNRLSYLLHTYWYYRGLVQELPLKKDLLDYLHYAPLIENVQEMEIDLEQGLNAAAQKLDDLRPGALCITFAKQVIGFVEPKPGWERLRGAHLRHILSTQFSKPLIKTMALHKLQSKTVQMN